ERALISIAKIYLTQKKNNEAIVHLKKLELTTEYRANYGFAVNNLMESYANLNQADETLKYAELVKNFEKSSEEDKLKADLFAAKAYVLKNDLANALSNFKAVSEKTKTILAAEATYQMAAIQFQQGDFKAAQQTAFDLIKNLPSYDYWVAKSFLLLADTYIALKDDFQAKSTLQSLLDNYTGTDEIIPAAKEKLETLNKKN
ncbi:MAG: tetratricopeptide repeat protein, partial [Sphingobacteriaceae bacterium]